MQRSFLWPHFCSVLGPILDPQKRPRRGKVGTERGPKKARRSIKATKEAMCEKHEKKNTWFLSTFRCLEVSSCSLLGHFWGPRCSQEAIKNEIKKRTPKCTKKGPKEAPQSSKTNAQERSFLGSLFETPSGPLRGAPREAQESPRGCQERPKRAPREAQESPREPKRGPREAKSGPREPKRAQEGAREPKRELREAQECPKSGPREAQESPRVAQERPKRAQESPRGPKRGPRDV